MTREFDKGYTFKEAMKAANRRTTYPNKTNLRIVYGTRTGKFYFILPGDRDYDASFSVDLYNFQKIKTSKEAKETLLGRIND